MVCVFLSFHHLLLVSEAIRTLFVDDLKERKQQSERLRGIYLLICM